MKKTAKEKEKEMASKKKSKQVAVERFKTGCTVLDCILSEGRGTPGGYPIKMMTLNSHSKAGKTRLALETIYQAYKMYGKNNVEVLYIDAERGMSIDTESCYGYILEEGVTLVTNVDTVEQLQVVVVNFCDSGDPNKKKIIVVDSLDALPDIEAFNKLGERQKMEKKGEMEVIKTFGMTKAKVLSEVLSTINGITSKTNTHLLIIQQVRSNVNAGMFGKKTTTSGGNAPGFYTSVTLELRRADSFGEKNRESGYLLEIFGDKTRTKYEKRKAYIAINHSMGFDTVKSDLMFLYDLITDIGKFDEPKSRALKWDVVWNPDNILKPVETVSASQYKEFCEELDIVSDIRREYGRYVIANIKDYIAENKDIQTKFIEKFEVMDLDTMCSYIEEHDLEEELADRVRDKFFTIEESIEPKNRKSKKL